MWTALGLFNYHVARRLGFAIMHDTTPQAWRPWWNGKHVRGTWQVTTPQRWT